MLNDEEISCEWPSVHASTTSINLIYCMSVGKLSQLISLVMRKSSSVAALQRSPQDLVSEVTDLERQRNTLQSFIMQYIPLDSPTSAASPSSGLNTWQTLYIRMLYYVLVASIHTVFTNPWSRCALKPASHSEVKVQVEKSINIVADASRNAILTSQDIRINASTPNL